MGFVQLLSYLLYCFMWDSMFFCFGFIGVDVFFVISFYLITSIMLAELSVSQFSILTFYELRARRILPALFAVMLACTPFWVLSQIFLTIEHGCSQDTLILRAP